MKYPKPLKINDTIGLIAPAGTFEKYRSRRD